MDDFAVVGNGLELRMGARHVAAGSLLQLIAVPKLFDGGGPAGGLEITFTPECDPPPPLPPRLPPLSPPPPPPQGPLPAPPLSPPSPPGAPLPAAVSARAFVAFVHTDAFNAELMIGLTLLTALACIAGNHMPGRRRRVEGGHEKPTPPSAPERERGEPGEEGEAGREGVTMEQAAAADAEAVDEERGGASRMAIGDAAAPPQEDAMPDGGPPPPPPPRARWATTPPRAQPDGTTSDEDDYLLSTDHRPASMPSWSPMPSPVAGTPTLAANAAELSSMPSPMPSALVDATAVGATHAAALSTAAAAAPPPGTVGTPGRERVQRARAALVTGMPSLRSLTAEALAERQAALSELVASLQVQKAALTTLSELDADAGVATLLKRNAAVLGEELRRTRAMVGDGASGDGGDGGGDGRAAVQPAFTSPGAVITPASAVNLLGAPSAAEGGEVAALRRLASELFDAGKRLDFQGEQLARVEAKATDQLPADVRSLLVRRREALRLEREFLSRRLAVIAQKMEANYHSARRSQSAWLETQVILSEVADFSPPSLGAAAPGSRLYSWREAAARRAAARQGCASLSEESATSGGGAVDDTTSMWNVRRRL